jgi:hypothetical protein
MVASRHPRRRPRSWAASRLEAADAPPDMPRASWLDALSSPRRPAAPAEQATRFEWCCACSLVGCSASATCCKILTTAKCAILHSSRLRNMQVCRLTDIQQTVDQCPTHQQTTHVWSNPSTYSVNPDTDARTCPCHLGRRLSAGLHAGRTNRSQLPVVAALAEMIREQTAVAYMCEIAPPVSPWHAARQLRWSFALES